MTTKQALNNARRGAAFLDKKLGSGWHRKIKRTKLNMAIGEVGPRGCGCILAQIYPEGEYDNAAILLGLDPYGERVAKLGFLADDEDYPLLTEAWREVLRERTTA